jgi:hypothetical protein
MSVGAGTSERMARYDDSREPGGIRVVPVPDIWPPLDDSQADGGPTPAPSPPSQHRPPRPADGSPRDLAEGENAANWPRQFAVLLAEALAGVRPAAQLRPWLSARADAQAQRVRPLFCTARQLRVVRVITTRPARHVIEMTVVVDLGPRRRALAIRLEQGTTAAQEPRWLCTAVEAALLQATSGRRGTP